MFIHFKSSDSQGNLYMETHENVILYPPQMNHNAFIF